MTATAFSAELRARLRGIADGLIPGTAEIPWPGEIDIAGRQLDVVLVSRPDLADDLRRALDGAGEAADPIELVSRLAAVDPAAHDALVTVVVAGYYLHGDVKRRLGYPGQVAAAVSVDAYPDYAHEGQLERVLERGPIYRRTPPG